VPLLLSHGRGDWKAAPVNIAYQASQPGGPPPSSTRDKCALFRTTILQSSHNQLTYSPKDKLDRRKPPKMRAMRRQSNLTPIQASPNGPKRKDTLPLLRSLPQIPMVFSSLTLLHITPFVPTASHQIPDGSQSRDACVDGTSTRAISGHRTTGPRPPCAAQQFARISTATRAVAATATATHALSDGVPGTRTDVSHTI